MSIDRGGRKSEAISQNKSNNGLPVQSRKVTKNQ